MNKKKVRTSKLILWLFIALFVYVICKGVNYDFSGAAYVDTAIFCACIASVSGISGAIVTKYLNNSNSENIPRIQMALYKESMNIRLEYNEKMLALKQQYHVNDFEIDEMEGASHLADVSDSILNQAISELDARSSQAHEDVSIQSY